MHQWLSKSWVIQHFLKQRKKKDPLLQNCSHYSFTTFMIAPAEFRSRKVKRAQQQQQQVPPATVYTLTLNVRTGCVK